MNRPLLLVFVMLALTSNTMAEDGDTVFVQSHNETHWDWNGSWYDTTAFPETGTYQRILMYYTLGCPSIGCSEWDYTTRIEVEDQVDDSTSRWVEMTRIITPYAGNKGPTWKHTWVIDVTDYAPILRGERRVKAQYDGWQDGFTVSVKFAFIEGTPPREVLAVNTLYDGTFRYGFAEDPIEDHLSERTLEIDSEMESAKFRLVASGHSFGGNENCAEFCRKWYRLRINGTQRVQEDVWRYDCGSNPLEAQTGTWIYNRAGWCPGDITTRYDTEVGSWLSAGGSDALNVDWQSYNYTGGAGFDPQYIIESVLFQYGPWNFENDAALIDVIRPSVSDRHREYNPICNNPIVVIENTGSEYITRATLEFWVEGSPHVLPFEFSGLILQGDTAHLQLPSFANYLFGGKSTNVFHARITSVNRGDDEYAGNNEIRAVFNDPPQYPATVIVGFNNNGGGAETSYRIENEKGEVVYERVNAAAFGMYTDTVSLDTGCYTLTVQDSDCDGLQFFANGDGNGRVWLHSGEEGAFFPPLHMFESQFGCEARHAFTVGYDINEVETTPYPEGLAEKGQNQDLYLTALPNPSQGNVQLVLSGDVTLGGTLNVYTLQGTLVTTEIVTTLSGTRLDDLSSGTYLARYMANNQVVHAKFVVLR